MSGINKVILIGNLTKDPEVRFVPNGGAVANVTIATNEKWKDKNTGQMQEKAEFHRVVIFGKLAEIAGEYLKKGSSVYFEGKLQTRKWQDQATGADKYTTEVVIDFGGQMQMLGGKSDGAQQQPGGFAPKQQAPQQQMQQQAPQQNMPQHVAQHSQQAQGGFQPRQAPSAPPEPSMDFDSNIPF